MCSPDRRRIIALVLGTLALACVLASVFIVALDHSRAIAQSGVGPPGLRWSSGPRQLVPPKQQHPPPP